MGKRGPKPKGKVKIKWSANFAYAIGLLVTDGNLSSDGRHIIFVSKEIEQINNFIKCFGIKTKIGKTVSGYDENFSHRVQFGDVLFYRFLESIGMTSAKSKTVGNISVPKKYFFDFLRGCLDGDGCFYSYWDSRWKSSYMFYLTFSSASLVHTLWIQKEIHDFLSIKGHISKSKRLGSIYNLRYAKKEALEIIKKMYYTSKIVCLSRKWIKIQKALEIDKKQQKLYARVL